VLQLLALHQQNHFAGRSAGCVAAVQLLLLLLLLLVAVVLPLPWMCGLAAQALLLLCWHLQLYLRTQRQTVLPAPAQHLQRQHNPHMSTTQATNVGQRTLCGCKVRVRT
jgi:hypothetical protein